MNPFQSHQTQSKTFLPVNPDLGTFLVGSPAFNYDSFRLVLAFNHDRFRLVCDPFLVASQQYIASVDSVKQVVLGQIMRVPNIQLFIYPAFCRCFKTVWSLTPISSAMVMSHAGLARCFPWFNRNSCSQVFRRLAYVSPECFSSGLTAQISMLNHV